MSDTEFPWREHHLSILATYAELKAESLRFEAEEADPALRTARLREDMNRHRREASFHRAEYLATRRELAAHLKGK